MRGKHHRATIGDVFEFIDEHRAKPAQLVDNEAVVDDLVADIDRWAVALDRQFDDPDRAVDVVATITNVRSTCSEATDPIVSTASFDVVASRRDAGAARTVVLPVFDIAMQAGTQVVAKRVGGVSVTFAAGRQRGSGRGGAMVRINRASTGLPEDVRLKLIQRRKSGDVNAAIDPLSDPVVRAAVARATFEHLIGFQLTQEQLRYNATR